jgi:hypothetical protein
MLKYRYLLYLLEVKATFSNKYDSLIVKFEVLIAVVMNVAKFGGIAP